MGKTPYEVLLAEKNRVQQEAKDTAIKGNLKHYILAVKDTYRQINEDEKITFLNGLEDLLAKASLKIEKKASLKIEKKASLKIEKKASLKIEKKASLKIENPCENLTMREVLDQSVFYLDYRNEESPSSLRLHNSGIQTIRQLVEYTEERLSKKFNIGRKTVDYVKKRLENMDLHLGMKTDEFYKDS